MNEKDIVRLAEEAELWLHSDRDYAKVEKFANLVAAAENQRLVLGWQMQPPSKSFEDAVKDAIEAEREACAKLCDENTNPNADKYEPVSQYQSGCYITAEYLATAIRARGQV